MTLISTALSNLIILLAIGAVVGLIFNRYGRSGSAGRPPARPVWAISRMLSLALRDPSSDFILPSFSGCFRRL
jgi:hypothetical protein